MSTLKDGLKAPMASTLTLGSGYGDSLDSHPSKPNSILLPVSEKDQEGRELNAQHNATRRKRRRNLIIAAILAVVLLAVIIPVAVVYSRMNSSNTTEDAATSHTPAPAQSSKPPPNPAKHKPTEQLDIPKWAVGGYLDVSDWYTTKDFNTTFTDEKIGGLYVMGLNSTWSDKTRANKNVPPLNEAWPYGTTPIRGVNIGGWLDLEPFISTSLFDVYEINLGIVDEWTLMKHLGPTKAKQVMELHYAQFLTENTMAEIAATGFDHIRVPFGYWMVETYDDDPYVKLISFRYLLRGIEYARKYGLRVFLDLHAVPGSQNGYTHSGRVGPVHWLAGPNGALNGQRTLEIHKQLVTFFSQPRYQNIITLYGLVNEPDMPTIGSEVVINWYEQAIPMFRTNGYENLIIMGNGFENISWWQGQMQGYPGLVLDVHQYMVYDDLLLSFTHAEKVNFACDTWSKYTQSSMNLTTGFGPTIFGEFSYADTECALYQNGVGVGSRWNGTYQGGGGPACPLQDAQCTCSPANAFTNGFNDGYKSFMTTFVQAQMDAFEYGWGWFHWTWISNQNAPQWSYKAGKDAGYLPSDIYARTFNCEMDVPNFVGMGLPESY